MRRGILFNKEAGTGKVMVFVRPHTKSKILCIVNNGMECNVLEGPIPTEDYYPGIYLYKVRTAEFTGYVNIKYVKEKRHDRTKIN